MTRTLTAVFTLAALALLAAVPASAQDRPFNTQNILQLKQQSFSADYQFTVFGGQGETGLSNLIEFANQRAQTKFHLLLGNYLRAGETSDSAVQDQLAALSNYELPTILTPGENELVNNNAVSAYQKHVGQPMTAFTVGGIKFIQLRNSRNGFSQRALEFLNSQLEQANNRGNRKIVLLGTGVALGDWAEMPSLAGELVTQDAQQFRRAVEQGRADYVLAGSPGVYAYQRLNGVRYVITGGTQTDSGLVPQNQSQWTQPREGDREGRQQVWYEGPNFLVMRYHEGLLNHLAVTEETMQETAQPQSEQQQTGGQQDGQNGGDTGDGDGGGENGDDGSGVVF